MAATFAGRILEARFKDMASFNNSFRLLRFVVHVLVFSLGVLLTQFPDYLHK